MAGVRGGHRLSIRRLAVVSAVAIGLLSVAMATALVWSTSALQDALVVVNRDARSMAIVDDLNLSLLTYQRVSNLAVAAREPGLGAMRAELATEMDRLLATAVEHAGGSAELDLLQTISGQLSAYLAERQELEERGSTLEGIMAATRVPFDDLLARMEELRELNEEQVEQANSTALRINRNSNLLAVGTILLLLTALSTMVWGVRSYVLHPIRHLRETVELVRHGDISARTPVKGPSEIVELGRTFNEMAEALGRVRESQLAFVAGIAHDLRDPLASLKLGLQVLDPAPSPERRATALETLDQQVDHLSRMVTDLFDATRIEAGQLELRPEWIDLRETVEHVVHMYAPTTQKHELVVTGPPEPATIRADPLRVQQVVGNLVSNAIKFSPAGGAIDIRVDVGAEDVAVSVTDRGVGLEPSEIDYLFLPFRRYRPDVAAGAGLGLSVVQRIVDAHGGHIDVSAEPGKGARFTVRFPRRSVA